MKKNYSTPGFMLVALEPNDIVCDSLTGGDNWDYSKNGRPSSDAKQRDNIWEDE